jgi:hypothetical protein
VALVAWIARRRPSWNAESAGRVFAGGMVGISLLGAVYFTASVHETWSTERDLDQAVGRGPRCPRSRRPTTSS